MPGIGRPRRFIDVRSPTSRLVGVQRIVDIGSAANRDGSQSGRPDIVPQTDLFRRTRPSPDLTLRPLFRSSTAVAVVVAK